MKRKVIEWEKKFAMHIYNNGLSFRIYKGVLQIKIKTDNQIEKLAKDLNTTLQKRLPKWVLSI